MNASSPWLKLFRYERALEKRKNNRRCNMYKEHEKLTELDISIANIERILNILYEQRRELVNYLGLNKDKKQ